MSEDQDLDVRRAGAAGQQPEPGHQLPQDQIQQSQRHDGRSCPTLLSNATTTSTKNGRLGKGELRGMVEDYLTEHRGQQFSPSAIGKALARSSGAVTNALDKLVAEGYAIQTQDKPKRFTATTTSATS